MTMTAGGVAKLIEEMGELQQALGKKLAYWHSTDPHPDGTMLLHRIEEEIADVRAAIELVTVNLSLSRARIDDRYWRKIRTFRAWDEDPTNNTDAIDRPAPHSEVLMSVDENSEGGWVARCLCGDILAFLTVDASLKWTDHEDRKTKSQVLVEHRWREHVLATEPPRARTEETT